MLVHKQTLGVLETAPWDGSFRTVNGERTPVLRRAALDRLELDPAEWWEVPDGSALARAIRLCWPWFDPVVAEGELVGAERWPPWRVYGEPEPPRDETAPPVQKRRRVGRRAGLKLG